MTKTTYDTLKTITWNAANILRGSIDSADYKNYILGLLFLKRISDVFEEEAERIEAATGNHDLAWNDRDEHQFFVPEEARWEEIRKATKEIGTALDTASAKLEEVNPTLEGVLASINFNDALLGEPKQRDTTLAKLVQNFSAVSMRNEDLAEPDLIGSVYEYLIEQFADDAGKKGGEFFTPPRVRELIVALLKPTEGMRVADPTVGSGGFLLESARYVAHHGGNPKNLSLFGQEKNVGTWAIAKMNMLLHGLPDADIRKGDTIREPQLLDAGRLMLFDRVVANPPFSLAEWGHETAKTDPYGRFAYGIPPRTKGDFAFILHMVATVNEHGMVGVVVPHGVLFRGGAEGAIRQKLLENDLVEAVVGLPPALFFGTGIPAAVLILNRDKPAERKGKVLFVDASREFEPGKKQNRLRDEDIAKIVATFDAFADAEKYARVVAMDEVAGNDWNLNISRYVDTAPEEEAIDVQAAIRELRALEAKRDEVRARLDGYLKALGYEV